jgi:hypothetical protein
MPTYNEKVDYYLKYYRIMDEETSPRRIGGNFSNITQHDPSYSGSTFTVSEQSVNGRVHVVDIERSREIAEEIVEAFRVSAQGESSDTVEMAILRRKVKKLEKALAGLSGPKKESVPGSRSIEIFEEDDDE